MEDRNYSEEVAYAIDQEIRQLIDKCYSMAEKIIIEHRDKLERLAKTLLEREVLEGDDIDRILEGRDLEEKKEEAKREERVVEKEILKRPTIFPEPA